MDEDRRRQIEEEERYRAQVRQNVQVENQQAHRPSYWGGFFLNLLITGLGFLIIGEWVWAVVWFVLAVAIGPLTGFIASPIIAIIALVHYRNAYVSKYGN